MAKTFKLPKWRNIQIKNKYDRKDKVISSAIRKMELVMFEAVEQIIEHYNRTEQFFEPSLKAMDAVSSDFYKDVVTAAFHSAKEEKSMQEGKKRLAAPGPLGLPRKFNNLDKLFRNKKYWQRIMKRSDKLTERLRKQYLSKLHKAFKEIVPLLQNGEISPKDAKNHMMNTWKASKSRVETIFRTETTTYFGKTQVAFFEGDDQIIGFLFDSTTDSSSTVWCRDRHGLIYKPGTELLTKNTPACHWNCRSHLIALADTPYNRKMIDDPARDPVKKKVTPLPPGWRK